MLDINHAEFIRNARETYKRIGSIPCPAFGGEPVYFTGNGFKHLIFKKRRYRPKYIQLERIWLMPKAVSIIKSSELYSEYRVYNVNTKSNYISLQVQHRLWSFTSRIDGKDITVVVRQIGNESKHFLSVMNEYRKAKTP